MTTPTPSHEGTFAATGKAATMTATRIRWEPDPYVIERVLADQVRALLAIADPVPPHPEEETGK